MREWRCGQEWFSSAWSDENTTQCRSTIDWSPRCKFVVTEVAMYQEQLEASHKLNSCRYFYWSKSCWGAVGGGIAGPHLYAHMIGEEWALPSHHGTPLQSTVRRSVYPRTGDQCPLSCAVELRDPSIHLHRLRFWAIRSPKWRAKSTWYWHSFHTTCKLLSILAFAEYGAYHRTLGTNRTRLG
jgi:hypothetical protein